MVDALYCPESFECVTSDNGPWVLYDSELIYLTAEVTNLDAGCEQERCLVNKATLTELDTCQVREDCAYVNLVTGPCPCLTTITVDKSAELRWEKVIEYDWTVEKSFEVLTNGQTPEALVAAPDLVLGPGQTSKICYEIVADREIANVTHTFWLEGCVRVCNTGDCPTEGLVVEDVFVVVYNGVRHELKIEIDMTDKPILGPGECYDYKYEIDVTEFLLGILGERNDEPAVEGAPDMSNHARAGITNFEGRDGLYFVYDEVEVAVPEPVVKYIDEKATLTDLETVPDGFEMDIVDRLWYLDGPGTIRFCKNVTNVDAECGRTYYLNDTARLVENDTGAEHEDDASVVITTPECECRGCTRTIGYWKNHDGSGPQADMITPLIQKAGGTIWLGTPGGAKSIAVTTAAEASDIISNAGGANGFNQLYAQMLASKLNVLNGACDNAIEETMAAADAFLATHNADDWDGLSAAEKQQIEDWKDDFDDYNNGLIGPGHCKD